MTSEIPSDIKELVMIVAVSENNIIGDNNSIPWHLPEDLKRFQQLTSGHPVIMGYKTFNSIIQKLNRPLPNRLNVIFTRDHREIEENYGNSSVVTAISIEECLRIIEYYKKTFDTSTCYVIGGSQIYKMFYPFINKIELTKVKRTVEGDTSLFNIDFTEWNLVDNKEFNEFSFNTYIK